MELTTTDQASAIEQLLITGDLSKLSSEQRVIYHNKICQSVGLNPLTRPFEYITLNGKLVLYAKRDATDQLRKINRVSVKIVSREKVQDIYVVTAQASTPDSRTDESIGAVNLLGAKGDALANLFMKAETKAKRRVTLSICGLGFLDETEVEAIPEAQKAEPKRTEPKQVGLPIGSADYVVPFGSEEFKSRKLKEIDPEALEQAVMKLIDHQAKLGNPLTGEKKVFVDNVREYLKKLDASRMDGPNPAEGVFE